MAVDATAAEGQHVVHIERGNGTTIILHTDHPLNAEELATATAEAEQAIAQSVPVEGDHAGDGQHTRRTIVVRTRHGEGPATHVETSNITRRSIVIVDAANAEDRADAADAAADAADAADAEEGHRRVLLLNSGGIANGFAAARCRDGAAPNNVVNEAAGDEHSRSRVVIMQCGQGASAEHRLAALRRARQSLAQGNMESSVAAVAGAAAGREAVARALANLDRQIAELEAQN